MNVHIEGNIPEGLSSRFDAIAAQESVAKDRLLADAIAAFVADYEWKKAVQVGLDEIREGRGIPHNQVMEEMDKLLRDLSK